MNAAIFLVAFRESFEALLLTVVLLTFFSREGNRTAARYLLGGALAAVVASAAFATVAERIYSSFDGLGQDFFQAAIYLVAAAVIAQVVLFLSKRRAEEAHHDGAKYAEKWGLWGAAAAAFVMVFREGVEMALFLAAILLKGGSTETASALYAIGGVGLALALGLAMYQLGIRIPSRLFFRITTAFLIFLAAGMGAAGVGKLVEIDWLPALVYEVWNTSAIVGENSFPGNVLAALFGYNANPSLIEAFAYMGVLLPLALSTRRGGRSAVARQKKSGVIAAIAPLALILTVSPADAKKVYSPIVHQGEQEIEYYLDYSVDSKATRNGKTRHQIEYEYAPWEYWSFGLYGVFDRPAGGDLAYKKAKLEIIHQFTEQGEYPVDVGIYLEYQKSRDDRDQNDAIEGKLLLERDFGETTLTLNPILKQTLTANGLPQAEWEYAVALRERYSPSFAFGLEAYGDLGPTGAAGIFDTQSHLAGPVIYGRLGQFTYRAGALVGLTDAAEDYLFTFTFEYEWY